MAVDDPKTTQINVKFDDNEYAQMKLVAQHYGVTEPAAVRMLVKREAEGIQTANGYRPTRRSIVQIVFSEDDVTDDVLAIRLRANANKTRNVAAHLANQGILTRRSNRKGITSPKVIGPVAVYERKFQSIAETLDAMVKAGISPDDQF
jgi:hypothetical protein